MCGQHNSQLRPDNLLVKFYPIKENNGLVYNIIDMQELSISSDEELEQSPFLDTKHNSDEPGSTLNTPMQATPEPAKDIDAHLEEHASYG